ncbi:F-box/kelch-repeat protein At3g06240-like [Vicia villosa]|uniref:F-box/kelch-repeat protein At3g06240-like n=1 Tax=Vicia villosa TaxID=3911 RepID=UPI00273C2088|nr:F-box/kelch-repeat protein At3g06240-like [Vicia villosa]
MDSKVSTIKPSSLMDSRVSNIKQSKHATAVVAGTNEKVKLPKELHIHDDIAFSILSKLSIKSLKRFECVCKSWSILIDNPNFMISYRKVFLTKEHPDCDHTSLLLHGKFTPSYQDGRFELFSISGDRFENKVKLEWPTVKYDPSKSLNSVFEHMFGYVPNFNILGSGSVNGILCLLSVSLVKIVVLWNPSINESKALPLPPSFVNDNHFCHIHRGFGYDRRTNDYKVICHGEIFDTKDVWEIYSLRTNSWRILNLSMRHKFMNREQLYMEGGLSHWMCEYETHDGIYMMLSFDWSNEVFIQTPVPSDIDGNFVPFVRRHLVLLKGSIALILNFTETATFHISVLGELGVKESWTKMFMVGLGPIPFLMYPVGAVRNGDMVFTKKDDRLILFNLTTQTVEDLGIKSKGFCKILLHRENLTPFEGKSI